MLAVGENDGVGVTLADHDCDCVGDAVTDGVGVYVAENEMDCVTDGVNDGVAENDGVTDGETV